MKRQAAVIGAGPAGLSAALALARVGFDTTVFEQSGAPSSRGTKGRVCGSFINPDGVRALRWLGLLDEARRRGAIGVTRADLVSPSGRASSASTIQGGTASLAFPREELEAMLAEALARSEGRLVGASRVTGARREGNRWVLDVRRADAIERHEGDLVVAAGGRFWALDRSTVGEEGWYGFNARFTGVQTRPGALSLHFGRRRYVGLLTFADGTTNVCGLVFRRRGEGGGWEQPFEALRHDRPEFARLMRTAERLDDWKGVGPLPFTREPRRSPGILLAGDAGAVGDPFMGEGIGRALGSGPLLALALKTAPRDDADAIAARYAELWRRAYGGRLLFGWAARWLLERPRLMSPVITALLRPSAVSRVLPSLHRGGGFAAAVFPSERS